SRGSACRRRARRHAVVTFRLDPGARFVRAVVLAVPQIVVVTFNPRSSHEILHWLVWAVVFISSMPRPTFEGLLVPTCTYRPVAGRVARHRPRLRERSARLKIAARCTRRPLRS